MSAKSTLWASWMTNYLQIDTKFQKFFLKQINFFVNKKFQNLVFLHKMVLKSQLICAFAQWTVRGDCFFAVSSSDNLQPPSSNILLVRQGLQIRFSLMWPPKILGDFLQFFIISSGKKKYKLAYFSSNLILLFSPCI